MAKSAKLPKVNDILLARQNSKCILRYIGKATATTLWQLG